MILAVGGLGGVKLLPLVYGTTSSYITGVCDEYYLATSSYITGVCDEYYLALRAGYP